MHMPRRIRLRHAWRPSKPSTPRTLARSEVPLPPGPSGLEEQKEIAATLEEETKTICALIELKVLEDLKARLNAPSYRCVEVQNALVQSAEVA